MYDRARHGIDMPWRTRHGLSKHSPFHIEDTGRDITRFARRGGEGSTHQGLRLLFDYREQAVPQNLDFDFADHLAHQAILSIRICPAALGPARKPWGTRVEVSASTITAGPVMRAPGARLARS